MILKAMADGEHTLSMTLKLSEQAIRHLKEGADKLGVPLETYAAEVIEQHLFNYDDFDWGDDPQADPRTAETPRPDSNELTYPADQVLRAFRVELERRLAART